MQPAQVWVFIFHEFDNVAIQKACFSFQIKTQNETHAKVGWLNNLRTACSLGYFADIEQV